MHTLSPQDWEKLNVFAPRYELNLLMRGKTKRAAIYQKLAGLNPSFEVWTVVELFGVGDPQTNSETYKAQCALIICGKLIFQSDPKYIGQGHNCAEFRTKEQAYNALQNYVLGVGGEIITPTNK